MIYTVGIRRRFLPFFKRYKVCGHETVGNGLVLDLSDGAELWLPQMDRRQWKLYPDYRVQQNRRPAPTPQPQRQPHLGVDDAFDARLQELRAGAQ